MSWLSALFAGRGAAQPIDAIGNVLDRLFTSDAERFHAAAVMEKLRQHPAELQAEINKIEAAHRSMFVAGWRPFIGWICGAGLSFVFLVNPLIQWTTGAPGPDMPTGIMVELVIVLLGMGTLRTFEKLKGVTK